LWKDAGILVTVDVNYAKIEEHPAGCDRLLKVMMRLEFALKGIGCCRAVKKQNVKVDWDRFANERLGSAFFDEVEAEGTASVLIQSPPKRQVVDGQGYLNWEQAGAVWNTQELVGSLRRVRNNLFHGGKSGDPDRDRNDALIANALTVLDVILQKDADLRMMFEGNF
jgi:hypothetical protein